MSVALVDREHGSSATYVAGCRCDECKTAIKAYREERQRAARAGELVVIHGTISAYNVAGCRCDPCCAVAAEKKAKVRKRLRSRPRYEVPHGTIRGYREWGCRCQGCTKANTDDCCAWKRGARSAHRALRERIEVRNSSYREQQLMAALSDADGELADLIAEQTQELARSDRAPSWMVSLDAPYLGEETGDRYERCGGGVPRHLVEWSDPTFDAVVAA